MGYWSYQWRGWWRGWGYVWCGGMSDSERREQNRKDRAFDLEKQKAQAAIDRQKEEARERAKAAERRHKKEMEQLRLKDKETTIKTINESISKYQQELKQNQIKLENASKEHAEKEEERKMVQEDIEKMKEKQEKELEVIERDINIANDKMTEADTKIQNAINKTNVDEGNIPTFLRLVNDGLLFATLNGQEQTDKLTANLRVFSEIMDRNCQDKLPIKSYFKEKRLERFTPFLQKEDYIIMDDLVCDDDDEFEELKEIVDEGIEEKKEEKPMNKREVRKFKKFCMRSSAEKTWVKLQIEKQDITRIQLLETSPKFSNFFGIMHSAMDEASQLLGYNTKLSDQQQKAIKQAPKVMIKMKNKEKAQYKEKKQRKKLDVGSECEIYSESQKKWFKGKISEICDDDEGEWLTVQYGVDDNVRTKKVQRLSEFIKPIIGDDDDNKEDDDDDDEKNEQPQSTLSKDITKLEFDQAELSTVSDQCNQLNVVAISKLHVVDSIREDFKSDKFPLVVASALTVAENVEYCCMEIIRTQCVVRQSVLLARELLKYKPAKPTKEAEPLWNAITGGIVNIFNNALEMSKISANYFGYFIKFRHSFQKFIAAHEINKNVSLIIALEHVRTDIDDFVKFQQNMDKTVVGLRKAAQSTMENCIKETAGATEFEQAQKVKKVAEEKWRSKKKEYHDLKYRYNDKFDEKRIKQAKLNSEIIAKQYEKTSTTESINGYNLWIKDLQDQLKKAMAR